jgi:hypothetical protein
LQKAASRPPDSWKLRRKRQTEWKFLDLVQRQFLSKANQLADKAFVQLREQLTALTHYILHTAFEGVQQKSKVFTGDDSARRHIDALFPDLRQMVAMDALSVEAELGGIVERFADDDPALRDPKHVGAMLQRWRQEDARPLSERRTEHYWNTVRKFEAMAERGRRSYTKMLEMGEKSRVPQLMPRHFAEFTFVLLFPRLLDHPASRKPHSARLCIWPEGALPLEQKVKLSEFTLPDGGREHENMLAENVADYYDTGDDVIDTADDPRHKWAEYPSKEWRGFTGSAEVALDVIYNYNFELDNVVFVDHNSFVVNDAREYFRRIKFMQRSRPYTFNPLSLLGLVP